VCDNGIVVRVVHDRDGDDLVDAWEDSRTYYSDLDPELFRAPHPQHLVSAERFVASLRRAGEAPDRFARVADHTGRVVGYIIARLEEPVDHAHEQLMRDLGKRRAYIEALGVHRTSWQRGVGRALMGAAERWARDGGAAVIRTDTHYDSPVSVPFYEAMGYQRQAIIFRKPL
jgi:GNAT superfamily N-acetyltransferase